MSSELYRLPVRVYYEDTDAAGVVYYANYLKFLERARSEWLRDRGLDLARMRERENLVIAVSRVEIDYRMPARLGELIDVTVESANGSGVRLKVLQKIVRGETEICHACVMLACLDATTLRPSRPGASLANALDGLRRI